MVRKTKADSQKTREALLDAAEALFLEKGVSKTTLGDIAEQASVTRGAVYWHFDSKKALFSALCDRAKAQLPSLDLLDPAAVDDPLAGLLDFCVENIVHLCECASLMNLIKILQQCVQTDDESRNLFLQFNDHLPRTIAEIERYFDRAVAAKKLPDDFEAHQAALALKIYQIGLINSMLISPETFDLPRKTRSLLECFFKGLYPRGKK